MPASDHPIAQAFSDAKFSLSDLVLPDIQREVLDRVTIHPSLHGHPPPTFELPEDSAEEYGYGRDELYGDALLKVVLLEMARAKYPLLVPSACELMCSALWSDGTLSRISRGLGLVDFAQAASSEEAAIRSDPTIHAGLFKAALSSIQECYGGQGVESGLRKFLHTAFDEMMDIEYSWLAAQNAKGLLKSSTDSARDTSNAPCAATAVTPMISMFGPSRPPKSNASAPLRDASLLPPGNYIGRLLEWSNRIGGRRHVVDFLESGHSGPPHQPRFECIVMIDGKEMGRGYGLPKKSAKQEAAARAMQALGLIKT